MILIAEPENFPQHALRELKKHDSVILGYENTLDTGEQITAIFCRLTHFWDESTLCQFPNLKFLITPTTGLNHIDQSFCHRKQIKVLSLRDETEFLRSIRATIEFTIFLLLFSLRKGSEAYRHPSRLNWSRNGLKGLELSGKNILIIGLGRVGSEVAKILEAFGSNIYFIDPKVDELRYVKTDFTANDLSKIDITILSASYEGYEIISKNELLKLKNCKHFINTSRAELVNQEDLYNFIVDHENFSYVSDVFWNENNLNNYVYNRFINLYPKCFFTPHIGGYTEESVPKVEEFMVERYLRASHD